VIVTTHSSSRPRALEPHLSTIIVLLSTNNTTINMNMKTSWNTPNNTKVICGPYTRHKTPHALQPVASNTRCSTKTICWNFNSSCTDLTSNFQKPQRFIWRYFSTNYHIIGNNLPTVKSTFTAAFFSMCLR